MTASLFTHSCVLLCHSCLGFPGVEEGVMLVVKHWDGRVEHCFGCRARQANVPSSVGSADARCSTTGASALWRMHYSSNVKRARV